MEHKAIFTGERCATYSWEGVIPGDAAKILRCDAHKPCVAQATGEFTKAYLEGSCDGKTWDVIATFSLPGMKSIDVAPLYVRPVVVSGSVNITVVVRR